MRVDGERRHLKMNDVPEALAMICYGPIAGFVLRTILSALLIVAGTKAGIAQSQNSAADPWTPVPTRKASLARFSDCQVLTSATSGIALNLLVIGEALAQIWPAVAFFWISIRPARIKT